MPAYKDKAKGTWYASFYFENWTGKKEKKMKRGFKTKREALEWERTFLQQQTADLDMTFESFVALYAADVKGRIKENTWGTKEHILYKKLVPYFGKRKMSEIGSKEVMAWQSEMLNYRDLLACLLENAPQSVERRFQPCSQALQAENQPRRPGRQYGQGQGPGNAVMDESGVSEIC